MKRQSLEFGAVKRIEFAEVQEKGELQGKEKSVQFQSPREVLYTLRSYREHQLAHACEDATRKRENMVRTMNKSHL